ncbi:MAG: hypothetical protein QXU18_11285 [Thermoplasmatales archaeon]
MTNENETTKELNEEEIKKEMTRLHIEDEESYLIISRRNMLQEPEVFLKNWTNKKGKYKMIKSTGDSKGFMADDYKIYVGSDGDYDVQLILRFSLKGKDRGILFFRSLEKEWKE